MGRKAKGNVTWMTSSEGTGWHCRVTRPDKTRTPFQFMPGIPREGETLARSTAAELSRQLRGGEATAGTVAAWWKAWLEAREAKGIKTTKDQWGRFNNWICEHIGLKKPAAVTSDDLRSLVLALDQAVLDEEIAWKTALNVWGDVTGAFDEMINSKMATLAVLRGRTNPCEGVRGPDRGVTKEKPFLYPLELVMLLSCEDIPLWRRRMYAVAAYSGARANELAALTPADVDLKYLKLHVLKQVDRKTGENTQTKTKRTRSLDIEPALIPLLEVLVAEKGGKLLRLPVDEERATTLRSDLKKAGCERLALHSNDADRSHIVFHGLRDTCLSHMAIRGDEALQIQWRAGHTSFEMTQKYIDSARKVAAGFGVPFPKLPICLLSGSGGGEDPGSKVDGGSSSNGSAGDTAVFEAENTASIPVGVANLSHEVRELEVSQPKKDASQPLFSGPDEAIKAAIKACLDAGEIDRAADLMVVLRRPTGKVVALKPATPGAPKESR